MWGSDAIAEAIADLGFEFVAMNPGASFRGLHDSLVNHLHESVELIVCLHEEHAVALAHGWSKVTGRPAMAIVHSNVGLMHATMAIYNAWVDRAPVVVLNAGGPADAAHRRPWIEWIHSTQDNGALIRAFTKWDDQPGSPESAVEALAQAVHLAALEPKGPVFVYLDVGIQEAELTGAVPRLDRPPLPALPAPGEAVAKDVASLLQNSRRPVLLAGRVGRSEQAWQERIAVVEALGAAVITDIKTAAAFPSHHSHTVGSPGFALDAQQQEVLRTADAVLALDWIDLAGTLESAGIDRDRDAVVISCSLDAFAARGWVKDSFRQPAVDQAVLAHPDTLLASLLTSLAGRPGSKPLWWEGQIGGGPASSPSQSLADDATFSVIASALEQIRSDGPMAVTRYPLAWPSGLYVAEHPLDYLGRDGGEGLASGPGLAVGAALALQGTGRLPVAIIGDGDFLMGATAIWTAANRRLPLLVIVVANGVYGNDVVHQERVARARGRPIERKWIGQRIDQPQIDIAGLARAQGVADAARIGSDDLKARDVIVSLARRARLGGPALVSLDSVVAR